MLLLIPLAQAILFLLVAVLVPGRARTGAGNVLHITSYRAQFAQLGETPAALTCPSGCEVLTSVCASENLSLIRTQCAGRCAEAGQPGALVRCIFLQLSSK